MYLTTCLGLAGLAAVSLTGDWLAIVLTAVVAFAAITAMGWEERHV
jgi:hypothetical protein